MASSKNRVSLPFEKSELAFMTTDYDRIERVIRFMGKNHREQPRLRDLARVAGLSEFYFHRLFSRWAGTTPKAFLKYLTAEHAKRLLEESRDVLSVSLEAGLSGPGRLHDLIVSVEGMSPGEVKTRGKGVQIFHGFHSTPFGDCLIARSARGVCHLAFVAEGNKKAALRALAQAWPEARLIEDGRATAGTAIAVFGGGGKNQIKVALKGSPFQLKVWKALLRIPPGHVLSYGDLASRLEIPRAARAVGSAVARNTIGFLIPCHRVIRETGVIGEYRWGRERKRALLAWEAVAAEAGR